MLGSEIAAKSRVSTSSNHRLGYTQTAASAEPNTLHALQVASRSAVDGIVQERITENGLRIWSFPDDGGDRFLLMVLVGSGSRQEEEPKAGVAHLLEHVLLGSTKTWTKAQSRELLDQAGGSDNGYTSSDVTTYFVSCASSSWRFAIDWLAQHLVDPAFNASDIADEHKIVFEELDSRQPHAGVVTFEEFLYPRHALGRSIGGNKDHIDSLGREDLVEFYNKHYRANNMAIGFAGRVPREDCMRELTRAFADLNSIGDVSSLEPVKPRSGTIVLPDYVSDGAWMHAGYHLPAGGAHELAAQLLIAEYLDLRSFVAVREERQLSYSPEVRLKHYADTSRLALDVQISNRRHLPEVVGVMADLFAELSNPDPVTLDSATRRAASALDVNSTRDLGEAMELCWWLRRRDQSPPELQQAIGTTGANEISNYARAHFSPQQHFAIANADLNKPSWIMLFVGFMLLLVVVDAARGFVWMRRVLDRWEERRQVAARRPQKSKAGKKNVIVPIAGDQLEESIQEFFNEQDGGSEGHR